MINNHAQYRVTITVAWQCNHSTCKTNISAAQ